MRCAAWPRGPPPTAVSPGPPWTEKSPRSRPQPGRGPEHGQQCRGALLPPMGSGDHAPFDHLDHQWPLRTVADIDTLPGRLVKQLAPGLNALPGAQRGAPSHAPLVAASPERVSPCARAPPAESARPRPPGDDETKTAAPSRRHRQATCAAARPRVPPASPRPIDDAYGSLGGRAGCRPCQGGPSLRPCLDRDSRVSTRVWPS